MALRHDLLANFGGRRGGLEGGDGGGDGGWRDGAKVWLVFFACLGVSAIGVGVSLAVFGGRITGVKRWVLGLVIAIVMLGISYGAKFNDPNARGRFSPLDLIQYFTQGFLWPSAWPSMADLLGIQNAVNPPPETTSRLFEASHSLLIALTHSWLTDLD